jgi:hypothetical protein
MSAGVRSLTAITLSICAWFAAHPVCAQSVTAAQVVSDTHRGAYVWVDGVYERVGLSTYGLGLHNGSFPVPFTDQGPAQSFNPRLDAGGVRGAIGTAIPGNNVRIELGGSFMQGSVSNVASAAVGPVLVGLLLTGAGANNGHVCNGVFSCPASANLATDYQAWSLNGKAAADWKFGSVVVTPSVAVFGGITRADQTFTQAYEQRDAAGVLFARGSYSAATTMQWRDVGARAGVQLRSFVTPAFVVGWGGFVGAAHRRTDFSGSDAMASTSAAVLTGSSTLTLIDNRTVLLANAEGNLTWHLTPMISLTGFVGLNYDSDVPGIAGPSWTGSAAPAPTSRNAAFLVFDDQTNLYAGGGLTVKFAGVRP